MSAGNKRNIIQIMPGLEGDLEEWQTQVISMVCHSSRSPEGPGIICFVIPDSSTFSCTNTLVFVGDNSTRSITIYL